MTGCLPFTGPVTVLPQRLFILSAFTRFRSLMIEPELLMMPPLRLDGLKNPALVKGPLLMSLAKSPRTKLGSASLSTVPELVNTAPAPLVISPVMLLILPPARLDRESPSFFNSLC